MRGERPADQNRGINFVRLGEVIVRRRKDQGLSTYGLAKVAGVANDYLLRIEAGEAHGVSVEILMRIAKALGTKADRLMTEAWSGPEPETLAERIAERAATLGLDRGVIAQRSGVSEVLLYQIEEGSITALAPGEYTQIARTLGVDPEWLRDGEAAPLSIESEADMRAWLRSFQGIQDEGIIEHLIRQTRYLAKLDRAQRGLPPLEDAG